MVLKRKLSGGTVRKTRMPPKAAKAVNLQTVEDRLDDKAAEADVKRLTGRSLGEMSPEERRKLLFG